MTRAQELHAARMRRENKHQGPQRKYKQRRPPVNHATSWPVRRAEYLLGKSDIIQR